MKGCDEMKAIHIKPGKIVEVFGELHITPDVKREVEILQFVKSFWGNKAICRVGTSFEEIPLSELEAVDLS